MKIIMKALVGSRAHGLEGPTSDWDWRGVFVGLTSEILSLGRTVKQSKWIEGEVDDTSYEIGHFLHLATKSNPSILELFGSPEYELFTEEARGLVDLFPYLWSSDGVKNAFLGYSRNQQNKFLSPKNKEEESRRWKYAVAYIRVLYLGTTLLETGKIHTRLVDEDRINLLKSIRNGELSVGDVVDIALTEGEKLLYAYENSDKNETDLDMVNDYLLSIRRDNW